MENTKKIINKVINGMKKCAQCNRILSVSNFVKSGNGYYRPLCKDCDKINRDTPGEARDNMLFSKRLTEIRINNKFEFTLEEIKQIKIDLQLGYCEVCGKELSTSKSCVDHNHKTNKYRGIICRNCNALLGHANDNIETLLKAIEYLKSHLE